jgi:dimethylaniline monooxygenase (N-oxide forming)
MNQPSNATDVLDAIVVGAGPGGIVSCRNILSDGRFPKVIIVERTAKIGGLWAAHTPRYSTLQVLTDDWTLHGVEIQQKDPARRASADAVLQWCTDYVEKYKLLPYIKFNTEIVNIERVGDIWKATLLHDKESKVVHSKAIFVSTGLENVPWIARFPGDETAEMPIVHNNHIRSGDDLPSDQVLIVGAGPSSMDIAQQCDRKGVKDFYLIHRKAHLGFPDNWFLFLHRWFGLGEVGMMRFLYKWRFPRSLISSFFNFFAWSWSRWYKIPAWTPKSTNVETDVAFVLRRELVPAIQSKRMKVMVTEIQKIQGKQVFLGNGCVLQPQMIVCATGWTLDLKFIPFYKGIALTDLLGKLWGRFCDIEHPNLFFISQGNGFMCLNHHADLVSRCAIQYMAGDVKITKQQMEKERDEVYLKTLCLPHLSFQQLRASGFKV